MKRKTHEEYVTELHDIAPHIQVRETYQGNRVPIVHYCTKHKDDFKTSPFNLLQHHSGCKYCQEETLRQCWDSRRKSNEQFVKEMIELNNGVMPDDVYQGDHIKMNFHCQKGHCFSSTPHDALDGYGCPYCVGNKVLRGYNDLWTTVPNVAKMLLIPDVGYEVSCGSHRRVDWVCPRCGDIKKKVVKDMVTQGLSCCRCSDGISYPNKFIISLLTQLRVKDFVPEWSPKWIGRYRYDVYFTLNKNEYIIEMDGGIGHGLCSYNSSNIDVEGLRRDIIKDEQALLHNIRLIRVDCKYTDMQIRFDYVKTSILNSDISELFDLNEVDWDLCNRDATDSLAMKSAELYNQGYNIKEISNVINRSYDTVYKWLKRLNKEGLCNYTPIIGAPSHVKKQKI